MADTLSELNQQQLDAVTTTAKDVLVLAGAGTGKTRTIDARAAHLIYEGVKADRIALITFTNLAADEMKNRIHKPPLWSRVGIFTGTFHGFCLKIMLKMRKEFGIDQFRILDLAEQNELLKSVQLRVLTRDSDLPKPVKLIKIFSYARNIGMNLYDYLTQQHTQHDISKNDFDELIKVYNEYCNAKKRSKAMDFDDILFHFEECLRLDMDLKEKIKKRYDHILVDEMQDTNPIQWSILEHLRNPASLFCVGDDAQSIYGFRGADFKNVHSFAKRIPGSKIIKLEDNYRSTQEILDVSNWLLQDSELPYNKELKAVRGAGNQPYLIDFPDEIAEAKWIVSDLERRKSEGNSWLDCKILTKTKNASNHIQSQLKQKEIPFIFIGGLSLFERAHIKDLLSALRIIINYQDESAWFRFLQLWPKVGKKTASSIFREINRYNSWEEMIKKLRPYLLDFPGMLDGLVTMKKYENDVRYIVSRAIKMFEVLLNPDSEKTKEAKEEWAVLLLLAESEPDLHDFITTCSIDSSPDPKLQESGEEHIKIITVHSAKGTEAKVCYLIRVDPDIYPHVNASDIEEERRVLYVALTRAQDELIITRSGSPNKSNPFHNGRLRPYSNYLLNNMPKSLVQYLSI